MTGEPPRADQRQTGKKWRHALTAASMTGRPIGGILGVVVFAVLFGMGVLMHTH
jgi:hypothetical protein